MRVVDFSTFPDREEGRAALLDALDRVDLGDGERTEPIGDDVPLAVGWPDDLADEDLRDAAEAVRGELEQALGHDVTVRFQLADGPADTAGGSPDHVE